MVLDDMGEGVFGTSVPNDSYVLPRVEKPRPVKNPGFDPYEGLSEMVEEAFSDNKRIGRKHEHYEF